MPDIYIEKLRVLEDQVPPLLSGEAVKETIAKDLGLDKIENVFHDFNENPIGSASIGQVHKAYIFKRGRKIPVAVKVQSPESERLLRNDLNAARRFCKVFAPEQLVMLDEVGKMFSNEFDYQVEAKNLRDVGENMSKAGFDNLVVVPKPHHELCSKHVLTMEFLEGPKLVDGIRKQLRDYARYKGVDPVELEREMKDKMMREGLPPPYDGPSAFQLEMYRQSLAARDGVINTFIWFGNALLSIFSSSRIGYVKSFIPLNSAKIMETLLKVHGHQLLVNGVFNSDPHPGNFLLLNDGRIGMIDYGQVKRLTDDERIHIAELIHHLARKDIEAVAKKSIEMGYESKFNDRDVIFKLNQVVMDQDGRHITEGLNMQQYIDKLYAKDPWDKSADYMIMPVRLSLLLRGVGHMLTHPVSVATAWNPIAARVMALAN